MAADYTTFLWLLKLGALVNLHLIVRTAALKRTRTWSSVGWVNGVAWLMVLQIVVCQVFVWLAILTERFETAPLSRKQLATGLKRSIHVKNFRIDAESWGGVVGLIWMTGYWATLLPLWVYCIVAVLSAD